MVYIAELTKDGSQLSTINSQLITMSATNSTMLALATAAPHFALPDVATGKTVSLPDFADRDALLVVFLCAHCPYVHHITPELARIARDYAGKSVAISSKVGNPVKSEGSFR